MLCYIMRRAIKTTTFECIIVNCRRTCACPLYAVCESYTRFKSSCLFGNSREFQLKVRTSRNAADACTRIEYFERPVRLSFVERHNLRRATWTDLETSVVICQSSPVRRGIASADAWSSTGRRMHRTLIAVSCTRQSDTGPRWRFDCRGAQQQHYTDRICWLRRRQQRWRRGMESRGKGCSSRASVSRPRRRLP